MEVASDADIVPARAQGRALASDLGFSPTDATLVATAISEIARNIVVHAGRGEIELGPVYEADRRGLIVVARDSGPGIRDVDAALREGFGSKGGLGLGLPGARGIMDEFAIETAPNEGTTVTMHMWRDLRELNGAGR
jgi:serine/threonine-protein kinase RsbT